MMASEVIWGRFSKNEKDVANKLEKYEHWTLNR